MRVLATVLGSTALLGSVFVGANWKIAHSEATKAADGYQLAQIEIESLNDLRTGEQQLEDSIVRNLDEGVGGRKDAIDLRADASKNLGEMKDTLLQLSEQQDIAAANESSLTVYSAVIQRDIHIAYLLGILWVAFGFAWGLAPKKKRTC